jgi:cytochrome c biogenesis protein CcmG/thiol:disulfide interchange protein DsbE
VDFRRLLVIIGAGVVAIAAIWLAAAQPWAAGQSAGAGGASLDVAGTTIEGAAFDSARYAGRPVVVNFFASWCPPCNAEARDLAAFARAHPEVGFVGVTVNDKVKDAQGFVEKYGLPYPVVHDEGQEISLRYGVDGIPTTIFFDKTGKQVASVAGAMDRAGFEDKLKAAL